MLWTSLYACQRATYTLSPIHLAANKFTHGKLSATKKASVGVAGLGLGVGLGKLDAPRSRWLLQATSAAVTFQELFRRVVIGNHGKKKHPPEVILEKGQGSCGFEIRFLEKKPLNRRLPTSEPESERVSECGGCPLYVY